MEDAEPRTRGPKGRLENIQILDRGNPGFWTHDAEKRAVFASLGSVAPPRFADQLRPEATRRTVFMPFAGAGAGCRWPAGPSKLSP
jgi:hypothetical protein